MNEFIGIQLLQALIVLLGSGGLLWWVKHR